MTHLECYLASGRECGVSESFLQDHLQDARNHIKWAGNDPDAEMSKDEEASMRKSIKETFKQLRLVANIVKN